MEMLTARSTEWPRKKLGEMLLESGLINESRLKRALDEKERTGLKLGQILVEHGWLTENQVIDLLSAQLKLARVEMDEVSPDPELASAIPIEMAEKYYLVPLEKTPYVFRVATTDPMDMEAIDTVERITGMEVETLICTVAELRHLFSVIYGISSGIYRPEEEESSLEMETVEEKEDEEDLHIDQIEEMGKQVPVIRMVNSILVHAIQAVASDVHMTPEKGSIQLSFRIDGKLHDIPAPPFAMFLPIVSRIKILAGMDITSTRVPQDGRFTVKVGTKEVNIRVSTLPTIYGENLVLRLLDRSTGIFRLPELGFSDPDYGKVNHMIRQPYGMILTTGPTGCGKTTSLYSIIQEVNKRDVNIITLEDPVEYRLENIRQVQLNKKAGMTFASGLRSILRQDPDIIMVGEIRDEETASVAVQSALTGHKVLSTVHTNDAVGAVSRLLDMKIEHFLISSTLLGVIAQRLVRVICTYCKEPYEPPAQVLEKMYEILGDTGTQPQLFRGTGCSHCMNTGYRGRTGIFEVLLVDEMVREQINRGVQTMELFHELKDDGKLVTLKEAAYEKAASGVTSLEEAEASVLF